MKLLDELLAAAPPFNDLGPGKPIQAVRTRLESLDLDAAFAPHKIVDRAMAQACLAGLWLRFDFLDESHTISQELHSPTGSFWHGIMHRREPDYENAKYWFRRVGKHPIFEALAKTVRNLATEAAGKRSAPALARDTEFLSSNACWNPFDFVDLVAATNRGRSNSAELCQRVQLTEWKLLFDFCQRAATNG
jgi:hypothetical protein